jgi:hypothetical protein
MHNTQPWRFTVRPKTRTVEIHAALDRALRAEDPEGRGLHLSVGAAVFNLRVAAVHRGWVPALRLLPDPHRPDLLAEVDLTAPSVYPAPEDGMSDLFHEIWGRHTSRLPFSDECIPEPLRDELTAAAWAEQVLLRWPDTGAARRLMALGREGELRNNADPARVEESRTWVRTRVDTPYGIPPEALGPRDARRTVPSRDFLALHSAGRRPEQPFEKYPQLAVVATVHDRRVDWLRAGQAMQRILLLANRAGLRASMLHQAVEWPDLRRMLPEPGASPEHVQMILRLGHGPEGAATSRAAADAETATHDHGGRSTESGPLRPESAGSGRRWVRSGPVRPPGLLLRGWAG